MQLEGLHLAVRLWPEAVLSVRARATTQWAALQVAAVPKSLQLVELTRGLQLGHLHVAVREQQGEPPVAVPR